MQQLEPEHTVTAIDMPIDSDRLTVESQPTTNLEIVVHNRSIWVTFQKEGVHRYPQAETDPKLADVSFLAYPHRHIFHFRVEIEVFHNDREIEFIQFKRWLEGLYENGALELDYLSCEMLAENLIKTINSRYGGRSITVSVAEDNENGAILRL